MGTYSSLSHRTSLIQCTAHIRAKISLPAHGVPISPLPSTQSSSHKPIPLSKLLPKVSIYKTAHLLIPTLRPINPSVYKAEYSILNGQSKLPRSLRHSAPWRAECGNSPPAQTGAKSPQACLPPAPVKPTTPKPSPTVPTALHLSLGPSIPIQ